jgi:hypothetical protein
MLERASLSFDRFCSGGVDVSCVPAAFFLTLMVKPSLDEFLAAMGVVATDQG